MSTACPACGTDNRDNAMFCRGCLGKLPAFRPTAPSLLETLPPAPPGESGARGQAASPIQFLGAEVIASWLCLGVLLLVSALGLVVWHATSVRVPQPLRAAARVPPAPSVVPPARLNEEVEVLAAAHLREPSPPEEWTATTPDAVSIPVGGPPGREGPAIGARPGAGMPATAVNVAKARREHKDRKLVPVVAPMSGARAACDRYNPYGEVLCTQGGYPYRYATWSKPRRSGSR
ncbi:zinc ribbon domain-containing protein [Variovorax humicola]|uniref:Zinc ribbon domain-containing protein n=1 Tax=Variovorax humicola TaxID=1769758 RepID=A0ABU8VWT9_9BURK